MIFLILYILLALGVSFFCSISEAVLLSVRPSYVEALKRKNPKGAKVLKKLQADLDRPLAAILTANTIAHTVGAAGVGAQVSIVFGSAYFGVASAILTLLILVVSEIIPKTIGATYWQQLAPLFGFLIEGLTKALYPFVWLSGKITRLITRSGESPFTFSRDEMAAMAEIGAQEGLLEGKELRVVKNLLRLRRISVRDIMTPRPVIFSVPAEMRVKEFFSSHEEKPFSRIPLRGENQDDLTGYVLKNDLVAAQARDQFDRPLKEFRRDFPAIPDILSASACFDRLMHEKNHIAIVVDEYGTVQGLVTLEDVLETLIGMEITDELDKVEDMRSLARKRWRQRMKAMGIDPGQPAKKGKAGKG